MIAVAAWRIIPAFSLILSSLTRLRKSLPYVALELDYLDELERDENSPLEPRKNQKQGIPFERDLSVRGLSFRYDDRTQPVLQDLNFSIRKGETFGVIGTSGAGKSTLADLLIGLLTPTKGGIYIDGTPLQGDNLSPWLNRVGYVPQSPYIYDGSLAGNIAFGIPEEEIDRERVQHCCHMAAMEFLDELPLGLDTPIGERGIRLSGGQQQRVAIARALYRKPDLLIFDEATSSLDSKNEKAIQKTIYGLKGTRTLIIIAHRLSTVEDCDRILWLHQGSIAQINKPQHVLPAYKEIMDSKFESNAP